MVKVKVYSTPTCHWCKKTKEFLNENKVKFTDIDVTKNPAKAQQMIEKSGQMGVPVIEVDDDIIIGFKKPLLKKLLKLK